MPHAACPMCMPIQVLTHGCDVHDTHTSSSRIIQRGSFINEMFCSTAVLRSGPVWLDLKLAMTLYFYYQFGVWFFHLIRLVTPGSIGLWFVLHFVECECVRFCAKLAIDSQQCDDVTLKTLYQTYLSLSINLVGSV